MKGGDGELFLEFRNGGVGVRDGIVGGVGVRMFRDGADLYEKSKGCELSNYLEKIELRVF